MKTLKLLLLLLIPSLCLGQGTQHDRIRSRGSSTFDQFSNTQTLAMTGATPSVAGGNTFRTANGSSTTITNFLNGVDSQEITVVCGDTNTTIQNNATIAITGGTNFSCALNVGLSFVFVGATSTWVEVGGTGAGGGGTPGAPANSVQCNDGSGHFVACAAIDNGTTFSVNEPFAVPNSAATLGGDTTFRGPNPYIDIRSYGGYANATPPSTTASCTNGSANVTLAAALDFQDASKFPATGVGNGVVLYKCGAGTGLSTPPAPTVTPFGKLNGATTYNYQYVAEDLSGGLTAAGSTGTTAVGAVTLGINTVNLTAASWTNTQNGINTYTCSGNCNVSVNAPINITGFVNANFNGNYVVLATPSGTTFQVYSPQLPVVSSESHSAAFTVLACNVLTMPSLTVPNTVEAGSSDVVMRWWVYRNGTLAFTSQQRDPYYEDCGVNVPATNIPPYVPASPGAAVNKYLATTIVSGGGTTSIVVANAAGNTVSGQVALHDNSKNLLACIDASLFGTPCYLSVAGPFNAATVFTHNPARLLIPFGANLNQPWVLRTPGLVFEGGRSNSTSFAFNGQVPLTGGGNNSYALPVFLAISTTNGTGTGAVPQSPQASFHNINFQTFSIQGIAFNWDAIGSFGVLMDNVSFTGTSSASNVNIPPAYIRGFTESRIGRAGDRNACGIVQLAVGPPCMRFSTMSVAETNTTGLGLVGSLDINGFAMQGGGASYQFDWLPWVNSGGGASAVVGSQVNIIGGLREIGKGPFIRFNTGSFLNFKVSSIDDDAPNAQPGNALVDYTAGNSRLSIAFDNITTSVGGQPLVAGTAISPLGGVLVGANVANGNPGTTVTQYSSGLGYGSASGNVAARGTATVGYLMSVPGAPTVTVGGSGSCVSNCVAAGTYQYAIVANDIAGGNSAISACNPGTTDGTQTITVSWTPIAGQVSASRYRSGIAGTCAQAVGTDSIGSGVAGTNYIDSSVIFYSVSQPFSTPGTLANFSSSGITGTAVNLVGNGFKSTSSGTFTANRVETVPDATFTRAGINIPQTWSQNQTNVPLITPSIGGETLSASPRGPFHVLFPGALTTTWTGEAWTLDKAVTVTRVQAQLKTIPSSCSANAVIRLSDGTNNVNLTLSTAGNDTGAISQNYAAAAVLTVAVQTAATGCTVSPGDANVVVQYKTQ